MKANELRDKFLEFFKDKGHKIIPSASLIPENDPTALFTAAGMHPLAPYLLGEKHPLGQKLVDIQKCLRTGDIDEVGDAWHLTFFEMLGNWSLGRSDAPDGIGAGYWKDEAIKWSFEFLTDKRWLDIPVEKLSVTVFGGDKDAPRDEETARIWQGLGISKERICFLPKEDNWWGPIGETGPCGPCTEIFYDTAGEKCEIWNNVFMEFNKKPDGTYEPLKQKNVDTGMGLERTLAVLNDYDNAFETELFKPIIRQIEKLSGKKYNEFQKEMRIIADHLKAAVFILGDERGIAPSNAGQGYVLRRLIRRAVRYGRLLGIRDVFTFKIAEAVINMYQEIYPELKENREFINEQLIREEEKFKQTLSKGLREFGRVVIPQGVPGAETPIIKPKITHRKINGKTAFNFYQTFGFPLEMFLEELKNKGGKFTNLEIKQITEGFNEEMKQHQELSRAASAGMFKGGLSESGEETTKLHTATHLLLAALRQILGDGVFQKGSNITPERLRLDFSYPEKMTQEQIKQVEDLVNQKIRENLIVECGEMDLEGAKKQGAMGVFETKYGEKVGVYSIKDKKTGEIFSKEICGGPHAGTTGDLGHFKILKEEASSAGVRRIKAVLQ